MLRPHCLGIDLNARHGALLAVAEVVHALAEYARARGQEVTHYLGETGRGVGMALVCSGPMEMLQCCGGGAFN